MKKKTLVKLLSLIIFLHLFSVFELKSQEVTPPAGQAVVYVFCEKSRGYQVQISCDGNFIGNFKKKKYKYHFVHPGEHYFTAELTGWVSLSNNAQLIVNCEADKSYYIIARASGITIYDISVEFSIVDKTVGKKLMKKYKQF